MVVKAKLKSFSASLGRVSTGVGKGGDWRVPYTWLMALGWLLPGTCMAMLGIIKIPFCISPKHHLSFTEQKRQLSNYILRCLLDFELDSMFDAKDTESRRRCWVTCKLKGVCNSKTLWWYSCRSCNWTNNSNSILCYSYVKLAKKWTCLAKTSPCIATEDNIQVAIQY